MSNPGNPSQATPQPTDIAQPTFYDEIGGAPTFQRLVDEFYAGVATDALLRPLYPDADLGGAAERLRMFLEQYWGGPTTYSQQRGHPRLRQRHAPFRIGAAERDAWLRHMRRAVVSLRLDEAHEATLWAYLERAAFFMVNTFDEPPSSPRDGGMVPLAPETPAAEPATSAAEPAAPAGGPGPDPGPNR